MTEFGDLKTEEQVNRRQVTLTSAQFINFSTKQVLTSPHCVPGSETARHSEAHDVEKTEGGRGEELGPQGGDHH